MTYPFFNYNISKTQSFNLIIFFLLLFILSSCDNNENLETKAETNTSTDTDPTLDSINKLIINNVNDIDLYLKRSDWLKENGQLDDAFKDLRKAKRIDSTNAEIYLRAGRIMFDNQSYAEAKNNFETCLKYDPTNKFCLLENAKMELLLENYPQALEKINQALKTDKYFSDAYYWKGRYYEIVGDTAKAVSSYSTAIENNPDFFNAYLQIAVLYTAIKSDLAVEYYNSALEINPESIEALQNLGLFYQNTGQLEKALATYKKAEKIQPDNAILNYNKGYIYLELKNELDSAVNEFTQAVVKYPQYYQAYYNLGLTYERKGNIEKALNNYSNSLKIKPNYTLAAKGKDRLLN